MSPIADCPHQDAFHVPTLYSCNEQNVYGSIDLCDNTLHRLLLPDGDQKFDEDGLPLVYEPDVIKQYWDSRPREMTQRWTFFLGQTVPFVSKLVRDFTAGRLLQNERQIARDLRIIIENLGPTFIKLGQALSIRPDVIGPAATEELAKLQVFEL
jgi:aarF domain-containing kinase